MSAGFSNRQMGLMALALLIVAVSVLLAVASPMSMPPFSTAMAFMLVCVCAGILITAADHRRPPDPLATVFNPPGLFAYTTRMYDRTNDMIHLMYNSDAKDGDQPANGHGLLETSPIYRLINAEARRAWHPGYFDQPEDVDEIARYIQFLLSEDDTMVVGVGMLLSLDLGQLNQIMKRGVLTVPPDDYVARVYQRSYFRITMGNIGVKGQSEPGRTVAYFMLRPPPDAAGRRGGGAYMTGSRDTWQQAISKSLVSFDRSIRADAWVALCGSVPQITLNKPLFEPNRLRRHFPPVNPVKPPRPNAPPPGAATGAAPQVDASSSSEKLGQLVVLGRLSQMFATITHGGRFNSIVYAVGKQDFVDTEVWRVNNDVLVNDTHGFYLIKDVQPAEEVVMTVKHITATDYTITYNLAGGVEKEKRNVARDHLRVDGYGYEALVKAVAEIVVRTIRPALERLLPTISKAIGQTIHYHPVNKRGHYQVLRDALKASYGIRGFYVIEQGTTGCTVHETPPKDEPQAAYGVCVPNPSQLNSNYLRNATSTKETASATDEVVFVLSHTAGGIEMESLWASNSIIFGPAADKTLTSQYRSPTRRY